VYFRHHFRVKHIILEFLESMTRLAIFRTFGNMFVPNGPINPVRPIADEHNGEFHLVGSARDGSGDCRALQKSFAPGAALTCIFAADLVPFAGSKLPNHGELRNSGISQPGPELGAR
jgi:hypothetical protein